MCNTNTTAANPIDNATYSNSPAVLIGSQPYLFVWCVSARNLNNGAGGANIIINDAERNSTSVFFRGYKETSTIATSDGLPWTWRRIIFATKGTEISGTATATRQLYSNTSGYGYRRPVNAWPNTTTSLVYDQVFKGTAGTDWIDPTTAPLDSRRVTIISSRTRSIAAGNEEGCQRVYRDWTPINKTLVYDDDEAGDGESSSYYCADSKQGLGDIYCMDIFQPRTGGTTSSLLSWRPEASIYWHER